MYRVSPFMRRFAISLLLGMGIATIWVNLNPATYYDMIEWRISDLEMLTFMWPRPPSLTPLNLVAELLIPLFMFLIGKELWEAVILERGGLAGRNAILPAAGALGAVIGGTLVWQVLAWMMDPADETGLSSGWPMPIGGDVVLVYVLGRLTFERKSPALHLLLLVVIALDFLGLILLGLSHPNGGLLRLSWLILPVLASFAVWHYHGRTPQTPTLERQRKRNEALWPYVLAGLVSYLGVIAAGLPGALGLLPVIPAVKHAERSFGLFAEAEELLHDPLNRLAHALIHPITAILFIFGLTRGGFDIPAFDPPTVLVLMTYWIGKPLGFIAGCLIARHVTLRMTGAALPQDIALYDLIRVAILVGVGFTVPVLALDTALQGGEVAEAARLGLALTMAAGLISLALPKSWAAKL